MTVNTVAPDSTQLDLPNASTTHEGVNNEAQMTPVARRVGTPDDIAQIVAWLASKDSKGLQDNVSMPAVAIECTSICVLTVPVTESLKSHRGGLYQDV